MTVPTRQDAYESLTTPYPDIPSEYLTGLERGELGDWLQEVCDAGWDISIEADHHGVTIGRTVDDDEFWGGDDRRRVDIMIVRAYLAWKQR